MRWYIARAQVLRQCFFFRKSQRRVHVCTEVGVKEDRKTVFSPIKHPSDSTSHQAVGGEMGCGVLDASKRHKHPALGSHRAHGALDVRVYWMGRKMSHTIERLE